MHQSCMSMSPATITQTHPDVAGFDIGEDRFAALLDFIAASFQQGPNGPILVENAAYSSFDRFYEANGRFNALVGCNTWTAPRCARPACAPAGGTRCRHTLGLSMALLITNALSISN